MKLVVAEKPSVGRSIAAVMGADVKKNGCMEGNGYIVSWCIGHLVGLAPPQEYGEQYQKNWSFDTLPIMPDEWKYVIPPSTSEQYHLLEALMHDERVDEIICATDAGREGECIFRYVYNQTGCSKPVLRLWISSMEDKAIREGMNHLRPDRDYDALFAAGLCRAKADWLVGMNGTRLFSCRYHARLTVGRVQTPTLAMIVQRDHDVQHFVKQKFVTVELNCGTFIAFSERINEASTANAMAAECSGKTALAADVKKEMKTVNPPKLYDLTTLQREANRQFGYTAQQTLDYTQSLYEKKLVTYPRTDSQYLTEDMEQTAVTMVGLICQYIPCCSGISFTPDVRRCINNKKVSDHHAIIPTAEIAAQNLTGLPETEQNILHLIAMKLVLATASAHTYEATKITVSCEDHTFTASGRSVKDAGWKALESSIKAKMKGNSDENADTEETVLPDISSGQTFENVSARTAEHWTSPPKPFTEDTLLKAMETAGNGDYDEGSDIEKKGLGTPATRSRIIEKLVKLEYVERKNKQMLSTPKGQALIAAVPDEIKSAKLTADWETQLQHIEQGKEDADRFMSGISDFVRKLVADYSSEAENNTFHQRENIGKCPKCGKNVLAFSKVYACEAGKDACGFRIFKSISGKEISDTHAKQLLTKKKTDLIRGFTSKAGKKFDAHLVLKEDLSLGFAFPSGEIGKCPVCGKAVISYPKTYSCEDSKNGCTFVIWKTISGLTIPEAQAKKLLTKGKTDLLKGFTSKAGKKFDAYLVLKDEQKQVGFEFPPRTQN